MTIRKCKKCSFLARIDGRCISSVCREERLAPAKILLSTADGRPRFKGPQPPGCEREVDSGATIDSRP